MPDYAGKVTAPDFPAGMQWLNTDHPVSLRGLRGKVVVLDFWTYCCINCMHVLPDLKKLERKFPNELVVIGVHSAKFTTEKETDNIRQAILRYEVEHPVVNDKDLVIWQLYGVHAWPTVLIIDPEGKIVGQTSGEGIFGPFDRIIGQMIKEFDRRGLINREPLRFVLERSRAAETGLAFPGKVLTDAATARLFIADSNHNRIVIANLEGGVQAVAGAGETGMTDGPFDRATFNHPQGLALSGNDLYVADTENHAVRRIDLAARTVKTVAGTGKQARSFDQAGTGTDVALNSPWDLTIHGNNLYIAMAGPHQIWHMDLRTMTVAPFAGSGREGRADGPLRSAALAQPSGITTDGGKLYFADSEASAIRSADLDPRGYVETIVGVDLFEFGDVDGTGSQVRLQHPLGVVWHEGALYVADTYNNKIKKVLPDTHHAFTFLGTGEAGLRDGDSPRFNEPGGLSVADGKLYVADTNNHVIRVADLKTRRVSTIELKGLEQFVPEAGPKSPKTESVTLDPQTVAPGDATLRLDLEIPQGYKLNEQAPSRVRLALSGKGQFQSGKRELTVDRPRFPVSLPVTLGEGQTTLTVALELYYCSHAQESLCYFKEVQRVLPIRSTADAGTTELKMSYSLEPVENK